MKSGVLAMLGGGINPFLSFFVGEDIILPNKSGFITYNKKPARTL
jgi:hypothetical protein